MSLLADPNTLSLPFLSNRDLVQTSLDPQAWADGIRTTIPVRICEPRQIGEPFRNDSALLALGELILLTTHGSPITVSTDHAPGAQLLIPYRGDGLWTIDGVTYANPAGESLLYTPPAPLQLENTITAGVSISLSPEQLLDTALAMAGPDGMVGPLQQALQRPQRLLLNSPEHQALISSVYSTLNTADQLLRQKLINLAMLRLDDLLTRLLVLLLVPALSGEPIRSTLKAQHGQRRRLRDLVEWIDTHLDEPIALSDLEKLSHYSRRTLQYAFRAEYGCSPMQWVKARRMDRAKARLLNALPGESVGSIAASLGFVSASAFSRDFRKHHGLRAVDVFRRNL